MEKKDTLVKEWIKSIGIAVIITGVLYFIVWPMKIEGSSMNDTLQDGDYVLVTRAFKLVYHLNRGDIITLEINDNGNKELIVKRIIALEGDHIEIEEGKVYINSKQVVENYVKGETLGDIDMYIPRNGYFVLGDNRMSSKDSRFFGCIYKKDIDSKVVYRFH
jgi:signal peptidase I